MATRDNDLAQRSSAEENADENERPTLPGVRVVEPWPERSAVVPQSLRTRTSRWRAVAAAAIEGGAARVSLVDAEEATPVVRGGGAYRGKANAGIRESGARQVVPDREEANDLRPPGEEALPQAPPPSAVPAPQPPVARPRPARATVRMMIPGLRGPTGTRRMWARAPTVDGDGADGQHRLEFEPRLVVSRRWVAVALVVGALCVASVVLALRMARHRARLVTPPAAVHVP